MIETFTMVSLIIKELTANEILTFQSILFNPKRQNHMYNRDDSDTAIEKHHNIKVFCYMIFVLNVRHFEYNTDFKLQWTNHCVGHYKCIDQ